MPLLPFVLIDDYDYILPAEKIAEHPEDLRDHSKLLVYEKGQISEDRFYNIQSHLPPNSLLVLNNSRVIAARLHFRKDTGGTIEIFCLEPYNQPMENAMAELKSTQWRSLIGGASKWKPGLVLSKRLQIGENEVMLEARFMGKEEDHFIISFSWSHDVPFATILEKGGAIPLPPYIKRKPTTTDPERYQTVFAQANGSVAAPTAALHFTEVVFQSLEEKGIQKKFITLHVGAGTFKPVKANTAAEHAMHSEPFSVNLQTLEHLASASTIIAVGTTSLRTLESLYWIGLKVKQGDYSFSLNQWEAYELEGRNVSYQQSLQALIEYLKKEDKSEVYCRTSLLILPGYRFTSAKALVTNFHQPRSTLLLLIAAFIGDDWKSVYDHALANNYRFLSYGDSSLLWRRD